MTKSQKIIIDTNIYGYQFFGKFNADDVNFGRRERYREIVTIVSRQISLSHIQVHNTSRAKLRSKLFYKTK